jgi:hypothetical protein
MGVLRFVRRSPAVHLLDSSTPDTLLNCRSESATVKETSSEEEGSGGGCCSRSRYIDQLLGSEEAYLMADSPTTDRRGSLQHRSPAPRVRLDYFEEYYQLIGHAVPLLAGGLIMNESKAGKRGYQ